MEEFDPTLPNQTFVELQSGFEPEKVGPFLKHAAELGVAQKGVAYTMLAFSTLQQSTR